MKTCNISEFKKALKNSNKEKIGFVDVRTPTEYKEKHIKAVENIPLDKVVEEKSYFEKFEKVYIHCLSGARGERAISALMKIGVKTEFINVEGGIVEWENQNLPLEAKTVKFPMMRQVMIAAGSLVLLSLILITMFSSVLGIYLALFVALGMIFSGITGMCGMATFLSKMPWNK